MDARVVDEAGSLEALQRDLVQRVSQPISRVRVQKKGLGSHGLDLRFRGLEGTGRLVSMKSEDFDASGLEGTRDRARGLGFIKV